MRIFAPNEPNPDEPRAALVPDMVSRLTALGFTVEVESGIGTGCAILDTEYEAAGAALALDRAAGYSRADIVVRFSPPAIPDLRDARAGSLHVSFLDPFQHLELIAEFARLHLTAISLEMMPRTTLAQKMDAISSQASLAGYSAVITAAARLNKILPMMMTPAGTISPARFLIIGVGVAGLQAIATAKRLGARVDAFDTRPEVEEQVRSLGARFVKMNLGGTAGTDQGYARELTPEQLEIQRRGIAAACAQSDVVVCTAKVFGRKAPLIVTHEMIMKMKRGALIVDLAADSGGNVAGTVNGQEIDSENGVAILGYGHLERAVPRDASTMFASNIVSLLEYVRETPDNDSSESAVRLDLDLKNEILRACVLTHGGEIVHDQFRSKAAG